MSVTLQPSSGKSDEQIIIASLLMEELLEELTGECISDAIYTRQMRKKKHTNK